MGRLAPFLLAALFVLAPTTSDARPPAKKTWVMHTVKKGDSLWTIARRYKVTVGELRKINSLKKRSLLRLGRKLKVKTRRPGSRAARRSHARENRSRARRRARSARRGGSWLIYTVKRGDYLWRIADKFDVSVAQLMKVNRLSRKRIMPGQQLRVKRRGSQRLMGGVVLPKGSKSAGYVRMRPLRSWGTPGTVKFLQEVYADFRALHPSSVPGLIADLSREGGGHLRPHKSHQRGVDVDVSYFKVDNRPMRGLEVVTPETIDISKTWDLIRLYINTGHVSLIFMNYELQETLHGHLKALGYSDRLLARLVQYPRRHERRGIIRHSPGHHHHLHVRFDCKKASDPCARPRTALVPPAPKRSLAAVVADVEIPALDPGRLPAVSKPAVPEKEARRAAGPPEPNRVPRRIAHGDPARSHSRTLTSGVLEAWRSTVLVGPRRASAGPSKRDAPPMAEPSPRRAERADRLPRFGASR